MNRRIFDLGRALSAECPDNDCTIYLNLYQTACEISHVLNVSHYYQLSNVSRRVLRYEYDRLCFEMETMFMCNSAVRSFKRSHSF